MSYERTDFHKQKARESLKAASQWWREQKHKRKEEYNLSPKLCLRCQAPIEYEKVRENTKYCGKSCSAKVSNDKRGRQQWSDEQRAAISKDGILKPRRPPSKRSSTPKRYCVVTFVECKTCGKGFYKRYGPNHGRQTCSQECRVTAIFDGRKFANGSRKNFVYSSPVTGQKVMLESSWELEVATRLDDRQIVWTRPDPMPWTDNAGKRHLYYPDFYLPEHDLYLDPKNPWVMDRDREKMEIVSQAVEIRYGDLNYILTVVDELTMDAGSI